MNALDKALASLELDDVVPATGVTSADADLDALEALLEAPEATADAVDASPVEVAEAVTEALSEDVAADAQIDALGADLDDLDALLGSDVAFPTSTIEEVAQELAMVETREELYAETDADAAGKLA